MDQPAQKSNKVVWIIVGAFVVLAAIVGVVFYFALSSTTKNPAVTETSASPSAAPKVTVASKEQVKQNLTDLNAALKQAAADQAAAKAAIKDGQNQVKVGS